MNGFSWFVVIVLIVYALSRLGVRGEKNRNSNKPKSASNIRKPKKAGHRERFKSLQEFVNLENVVFLDTETTGMNDFDQIIELGIVSLDGEILVKSLVKPTVKINPAATKKHGLKMADLKKAPSWSAVYTQYLAATEGKIIMAYNSKYDKKMVQQSCKAHGLTNKRRSWKCVMLAYAEFMGYDKWFKLEDSVLNCGITVNNESDQQHLAVFDAAMAAGVFQFIKRDVNHILSG